MAMRPVLIGTDPFDSMRSRSAVIDCVGGEAGMQPSVGLGVIANNLTAIARARSGGGRRES